MKRDLDLMRLMMLRIEEKTSWEVRLHRNSFADICDNLDVVAYHLRILSEAGFIDAKNISNIIGEDYLVRGLTFSGCDYLDAVRDQSIWSKVSKKLASIGGSASIEIVKALAVSVAKAKLGI